MKRTLTLISCMASLSTLVAQDLQIQNMSDRWGFDYNASTGVISNLFFHPAEGDGVNITASFVVSWGLTESQGGSPTSNYTELDRQTITQGLPSFNAINVNNWPAKNLNTEGVTAGDYYVTAVVDTDDDIAETNENNNSLYLATGASDFFTFTPNTASIENAAQIGLVVYPNPCSDEVTVRLDTPTKKLVVTDLNGKVLWIRFNPQGNLHTVPMTDIPSGMYFVNIETTEGVIATQTLIRN